VNIDRYLTTRAALIERALRRTVPAGGEALRQAMRYSLLGGGKRIRPILTLAACEAVGGTIAQAMPFACAIEMIHSYSLVHDDLPAMDDDAIRRGRPTSHVMYGDGIAILVGDALLTDAFGVMAAAPVRPAARVVAAIAAVARAAGAQGMVGGQALDLASEGQQVPLPAVKRIHARKTGALLAVSVHVGALIGGASQATLDRLATFGAQLGLAFQIVDDILDAVEGTEGDGRTDHVLGKATYPQALGLAGAKAHARRAETAALRALTPLGPRAEPLRAITRFVVARADAVPA
jgi:geranylgeranyl diphosphate synthase, type II